MEEFEVPEISVFKGEAKGGQKRIINDTLVYHQFKLLALTLVFNKRI